MTGEGKPHPFAFALIALGLVASAVLFSRLAVGPKSEGGPPAGSSGEAQLARQVAIASARVSAEVEAAARRFFAAYLRYEVGRVGAGVRRAIREGAEPGLAAALLAHAPRAPGGAAFPPAALLQGVDVSLKSGERAVVEGSALRGRMPETFSFEFALVGGAWLASGAAG